MRHIRIKSFGKLLVAAIVAWTIAAGPALAARKNSDTGKQTPQDRQNDNPATTSRNRDLSNSGRSATQRSPSREQSPDTRRDRSSDRSTERAPSRRESPPRETGSRADTTARQSPPPASRNRTETSNTPKNTGGRAKETTSESPRTIKRDNVKTPRDNVGKESTSQRIQPRNDATVERRKDAPVDKGPKINPNADSRDAGKKDRGVDAGKAPIPKNLDTKAGAGHGDRNRSKDDAQLEKGPKDKRGSDNRDAGKHGGAEIGKAPIPKNLEGKAKPPRDNHNRSEIKDVHKRLDPKPDSHADKGPGNRQPPKARHFDQMKKGDLDRLAAGKKAQSLKLADQYRMYRHGDVARRMDLYKHGPRPDFHHGPISPRYQEHCFKHHYRGPSLFVGVHWYPKWSPWVSWSWGYHCDPYWDPRPIYCRPIVYVSAPAWVYWETPVWAPLPATACGTWVDLPPIPVADPRFDLQLAAVRFVDPGHPDEKLGPRYRVWFRNNGNRPIAQPFNVMLFAGNEKRIAAGLPQAGARVAAIGAGEVQSVDIRLPFEVYAMGRDAKGNPTPFSVLHALVDAGEEIAETTKANNGASLDPADVLPVDPASFELEPAAAKSGGEINLAGEGFGPQPGQVLLIVGGQEIDAEILGWYDLGVRFILPKLALAGPTEAEVIVVRGDRAAANPLKITLLP